MTQKTIGKNVQPAACRCNKKYLGAEIGFMEVLHTWGQTLVYHPHIHVIIPAGGIDKIGKWKDSKKSNKIFRKIYT